MPSTSVPWPLAPLRSGIGRTMQSLFGVERFPEEQYTDPPGDPGLFGPDSITWRVHGDPAMLVGGVSAVLLQALHPLAMAGVAQHSQYRQRPLARLSRTSSFVTATTYGSTPVAESIIATVRSIHERVVGTAPDGRPYRANDPELLRWVHMAEVASFLRAHRRYSLNPVRGTEIDRYFDEVAVVAERLGATDVPRSRAQVQAYFRAIRPELRAGEEALSTVGFVLTPTGPNPAVRAAYTVLGQAAVGLLSPWARQLLRLDQPRALELAAVRPAAHALLTTILLATRPSPIIETARARCRAVPDGASSR